MALLQNDKAIFYHPLDDAVETLKAKTWAGSSSAFVSGKISTALGPAAGAPFFGTASDFDTGSATDIDIAKLTSTKFIVIYSDSDVNDGVAYIATVSGTDITFGATSTFNASSIDMNGVCALSATTVVMTQRNFANGFAAETLVGTVSGTDVTWGSAQGVGWGGTGLRFTNMVTLDSTKFALVFQDVNSSSNGFAQVGVVAGMTVSYGTRIVFNSADTREITADKLTSTKIVVCWHDQTATAGQAGIGTVSGLDITFGAEAEYNSASVDAQGVAALDSTTFVVCYVDQGDSGHGTAKVGTASGTDITFGAEVEFHSTGAAAQIAAASLSSSLFTVSYSDGSNGVAKVGSVSGMAIMFTATDQFHTGSVSEMSTVGLTSSLFVTAYKDGAANDGTASAATVASGSDLSGLTADYDSAAAATKVAFVGWVKNPSA